MARIFTKCLLGSTISGDSAISDASIDLPTVKSALSTLKLGRYVPSTDCQGRHILLGKGGFASTWQYYDSYNGQQVAIKRVPLTGWAAEKRPQVECQVLAEGMNHHPMHHHHVIQLHHVFVEADHLNLVLELADRGSLLQLLHTGKHTYGMTEDYARWLFQQLVLALDYCHAKDVAHRDVKLENLLLVSARSSGAPLLKLADFGCSKSGSETASSVVGTSCYMAPEVLQAAVAAVEGSPRRYYDPKAADVWAAGVVLATLCAGSYPFPMPSKAPVKECLEATLQPLMLPHYLSSGCRDLLHMLLQPNPLRRITIAEVKQHPWFLRGIPARALAMTAASLHAPSRCGQSEVELKVELRGALRVLQS